MKKLFKMFATILAVSVLTIGFASCANDSGDSSSSATVSATYKYESGNEWRKIILYSDASVAYAISDADGKVPDAIIKKGSYVKTGDSFSSCTIEITWKEQRSQTKPYDWESAEGSSTLTVSNGSCTFDDNKIFTKQ